jgi:type IV pilus assembly protein PilN
MRVPVNLASEPFRRDRPMLVASIALSLALAGLLAVQMFLILAERGSAAANRNAVSALNAQLSEINAEQSRLETVLREPMNAEVLQRSLLLNTLIERKGISWARLLADIEEILPNRVRVIQVRLPQVNVRNEVTLDLEIGAENKEQAIDFMRRLGNSPLFGPVNLSREDPPSQNEPSYRYRLSVSYAQKL